MSNRRIFVLKTLYTFFLGTATILAAPILLWKYLFQKKYRGVLLVRLGLSVPQVQLKSGEDCFWVHAVSLGEVRASKAFIARLQRAHPDTKIIFSTLTKTGFEELKKVENVIPVLLPSDLYTSTLVRRLNPKVLFLVEGDIWPNMVAAAKRVVVINGKISQRTLRWLQIFPFVKDLLLKPVDFWCVQSEIFLERLYRLGVEKEKISITGDIKTSMEPVAMEPFCKKGILLVSSHRGEEKVFLEQLLEKGLFLMVAPRHPERFDEVACLLDTMGVPYRRSSSDEAFEGSEPYSVLLIDEIGVMPKYYRSAICTVVGGSLVEGIGGHNLIEPILYGSVPIYGPFVEKQRHLKSILSDRAIGFECTKATIASVVLGLIDSLEVLKEQVKKIENIGEDFQKPLQNTFLAVGLDHAIS